MLSVDEKRGRISLWVGFGLLAEEKEEIVQSHSCLGLSGMSRPVAREETCDATEMSVDHQRY